MLAHSAFRDLQGRLHSRQLGVGGGGQLRAGVMDHPLCSCALLGKQGKGRRCSALVTMAMWWIFGKRGMGVAALGTLGEPAPPDKVLMVAVCSPDTKLPTYSA